MCDLLLRLVFISGDSLGKVKWGWQVDPMTGVGQGKSQKDSVMSYWPLERAQHNSLIDLAGPPASERLCKQLFLRT